jgi:hypothetical protein
VNDSSGTATFDGGQVCGCFGQHTNMDLHGLDHFTIRTNDLSASVGFYRDIIALHPGPRPAASIPGSWLYSVNYRNPSVHLVQVQELSTKTQNCALDHVAFGRPGCRSSCAICAMLITSIVHKLSSNSTSYRFFFASRAVFRLKLTSTRRASRTPRHHSPSDPGFGIGSIGVSRVTEAVPRGHFS